MSAHFGLDIGSTSIKLIKSEGKKISSISFVNNPIGKNLMVMTNAEKVSLADTVKQMIKTTGLRGGKVVASIAESLVFSRVMKFPIMSSPELATAIKWELDQSVPFPPNEVERSWAVLDNPKKFTGDEKVSVYVVAVPSSVSKAYVQLLELLELQVERLENETPSLIRSFSTILSDEDPSIVVDFGATGTGLVLVGNSKIFENYYLSYGGNVMTKLISDSFNLPLAQAENYKRTYGIAKDQLEGKMFSVLKPVIDNLIGEVKKMCISYQGAHKDSSIGRVILTGGGSYLNGLIPYLTESLGGMEIVMGDSFSGLIVDTKFAGLGPVFAIAKGLSYTPK